MEPKTIFPRFWRRDREQHTSEAPGSKEVVVHKSTPLNDRSDARGQELLSYEDIYHAAGIMSPPSGYSIQKVIEMLNSERIRELSKDIQRASVLMALEAAGSSLDEILKDAKRRRDALNTYESGKKKQLEEFEAAKSRENAHIEQEMERVRTHYEERIQRNRDLLLQEKEALHNWQMAMQHELQRINDVMELCGEHPAPPVAMESSTTAAPNSEEKARAAISGRTV